MRRVLLPISLVVHTAALAMFATPNGRYCGSGPGEGRTNLVAVDILGNKMTFSTLIFDENDMENGRTERQSMSEPLAFKSGFGFSVWIEGDELLTGAAFADVFDVNIEPFTRQLCGFRTNYNADELYWPPVVAPEVTKRYDSSDYKTLVLVKGRCAGPNFGGHYSFVNQEGNWYVLDVDQRISSARFKSDRAKEVTNFRFVASTRNEMRPIDPLPAEFTGVSYDAATDSITFSRSDSWDVVRLTK